MSDRPARPAADAKTSAKLQVEGALGPVRIAIAAEGTGDVRALSTADLNVDGRLTSDDGAALARLLGVDRYVAIDGRPARVEFTSKGSLGSTLRLEGKFAGAGLEASGAGSLRVAGDKTSATFDLALSAADMPVLHGPSGLAVPVSLRGRLGVDGERLTLEDIKGRIAGSALSGRLGVKLARPLRIDGKIDADDIDAGAVIGVGIGMPAAAAPRSGGWVAEPFGALPLPGVEGRIEFSAKRAAFTPTLVGEQMRGTVVIEPAAVNLERIEGRLGDGLLTGQASARSGPAGLSLQGQFALNDADLAHLLPKNARSQVSGRITLQVEATGAGRSPAALVGDIAGGGTMTVEGLQASGLDPAAIGAAIRAGEQGVIIDSVRIGDIVRSALDRGRLNVPWAGGAFTISGGRLNFGTMIAAGARREYRRRRGDRSVRRDARPALHGDRRAARRCARRPAARNADRAQGADRRRAPLRRCDGAGQLADHALGRTGGAAARDGRARGQAARGDRPEVRRLEAIEAAADAGAEQLQELE